jgi:hypothetical protein
MFTDKKQDNSGILSVFIRAPPVANPLFFRFVEPTLN